MMKTTKTTTLVTYIIAIGFILIAIIWVGKLYRERIARGESHTMILEVRDHLYIGMPRSEADQYTKNARQHYECVYDNMSRNLYIFGDRNLDLAELPGRLVLRFQKEGDSEILTDIAYVESYYLYQFEECIYTILLVKDKN